MNVTSQTLATTSGQVPLSYSSGLWVNGRYYPPIAGGADEDPPAANPPATPPAPDPFDRERAMATIAKLREVEKGAKASEKELAELRAKVQAAEDAQLSETERLKKQVEEATARATAAETRARERTIRAAVQVTAGALSFADPDDAWRFIDQTAIELDESGEPKNVKKLLEDLVKGKPYLVKAATNGSAIPATQRPGGGTMTREQLIDEKVNKLKASGSYSRL